jgi:hypothetical protein
MAHFAYVQDGIVQRVEVVSNDALDPLDEEASGQQFLASLYPGTSPADFVQTSYSASIRGKYAGIGDKYDPLLNEFVSPVSSE